MSEPVHIISFGAGVQSSTMALMAAHREIDPMPTVAVFADTHDESAATYKWIDAIRALLPFGIAEVSRGKLSDEQLRIREHRGKPGKFWAKSLIPAHVANKDGTKGIMGRQCTFNYKVSELEKHTRRIVEFGHPQIRKWQKKHAAAMRELRESRKEKRACNFEAWQEMQADALAIQWIGISLDEVGRMRPARHPWIRHRWPLIEKEMTRHDCVRWLEKRGYPIPSRSACIYCPFHSDNEWRSIKRESPQEFQRAVEFERELQAVKRKTDNMDGVPFLHASLRPLGDVDFSTDTEKGQGALFGNDCTGLCGT